MTLSNMSVQNELDAPLNILPNSGFEIDFHMDVKMVAEMITTLPPETA
ncbi:MAG: hypothetical protein ACOH1I_05500 [Gallionellaceae bacterium]|jgi:hypothetical protein